MMVEFHLPYPPSVNHYWRRVRSDSPALHREGAAGKPVVRIQKASESMITLRPYQEKVKTVVFGCLQTHDDNRCTVAPAAGGNGQVPANECPDCQVVIAAGFARRPQCGYAFPPPERTPHEGKATEAEILSQRITDTHYDVRDFVYRVHKKRGGGEQSSKSLRVDYLIGPDHWQPEWLCFEPWRELLATEVPGLVERLVIERSQSGGRHVVYRCEAAIPGNRKLAQRAITVDSAEPVVMAGKSETARRVNDRYEIRLTLIETRGEGGLFLCDPTPGYAIEQGSLDTLPVLSEAERSILIEAACALNETMPPVTRPPELRLQGEGRPGDDFNERGDVREVLRRHGWKLVRGGENEYWHRPGKEQGWSATLKNGVLYVFSSNAAPFEPDRGYAPFTVYAMLEHGGDFTAAASALRNEGYGQSAGGADVDLSQLVCSGISHPANTSLAYPDPGPLPAELLRIPGFVAEVMDHCLATVPYPNKALAFCGTLALQAVLAGRKVRDRADNRTNLYLLALAHSSVGKDWPRKVNTRILHSVGMVNVLGDKFASGEGIQDAPFLTPAMLFQTDEIDGLLQSINKARDNRYQNIMDTLLTMYSTANSIYPMRRKAGKEPAGVIDQPCLVIYGTAIPTHYYEALSEPMLTNGFFARMLIVESGPRSAGQDPGLIDPPQSVMDTAQWWAEFSPGTGNLENWHPTPRIVEADDDASALLVAARKTSEIEYSSAEASGDPMGTAVWGRFPEQVRKLALLYAVSVNHQSPRIDAAAVRWATDFTLHQTRRMLFMANNHVAKNAFHAECLKLMRKLLEVPGHQLPHSVLLKRMKIDAKSFGDIVKTLVEQGDLLPLGSPTLGRSHRIYKLNEMSGETSSPG